MAERVREKPSSREPEERQRKEREIKQKSKRIQSHPFGHENGTHLGDLEKKKTLNEVLKLK